MKNLFDCCLIAETKKGIKKPISPKKWGFSSKNLFDCCLIVHRAFWRVNEKTTVAKIDTLRQEIDQIVAEIEGQKP